MVALVTGSTGFIGAALVKHLSKMGWKVHAFYRSEKKSEKIKFDHVTLYKGSIMNPSDVMAAMKGCDVVFHLAAFAGVWSRDRKKYDKINCGGTQNVLTAALDLHIKKVVVTSTAGVFGPSQSGSVNENAEREVTFFNQYEASKSRMEKIVFDYATKGLDVTIVNPTRVFGPGLLSESNSVSKMIGLYLEGKFRFLPGNGKSKGNYVFIEDIVKGHVLACEKGETGERYILGGENLSYIEFFNRVSRISGIERKMIRLPLFLMLMISGGMLFSAKVLNIKPLITPPWVRRYNYNWELSSDKAINELGYSITPFDEALERTIHFVKRKML